MHTRIVRSVYALAFVLLCSNDVAANTSLNFNNICRLLKNNDLVASGNSCTDYYQCSKGNAILQSCSDDTYFDKNAQACVAQQPSYCIPSNNDPCAGVAFGSYLPVPGSDPGFYYCSTTGAQRSNCPNDLVFDGSTQSCIYRQDQAQTDNEGIIPVAVNLCYYLPDRVYFGNAFTCSGWQYCQSNDTHYTGSCKNGLVFDATTARCNSPENVVCSQVTYDPQLNVKSANNGGTCTQKEAIRKGTPCNQYYVCSNDNWQLEVCSNSSYFDTKGQKCVDRLEALNDCDRCLGSAKKFVNEFGTNCTGYFYCANGVKESSGICENGLFFNEEVGGCVDENPDFPFCVTTSATTATPIGEASSQSTTEQPGAESTTLEPYLSSTTEEPSAEPTTVKPSAESTKEEPSVEPTTVEPPAK